MLMFFLFNCNICLLADGLLDPDTNGGVFFLRSPVFIAWSLQIYNKQHFYNICIKICIIIFTLIVLV